MVSSVTDYHLEYLKGPDRCGPINPIVRTFLESIPSGSSVLDLGGGQGRDAIPAARLGHVVTVVDIASSGLHQIEGVAGREGLAVSTVLQDIAAYEPASEFDVVLLDRVLHMLPEPATRQSLLTRAAGWVKTDGHIVVSDTRSNRALIRACFSEADWDTIARRGDDLICRRKAGTV